MTTMCQSDTRVRGISFRRLQVKNSCTPFCPKKVEEPPAPFHQTLQTRARCENVTYVLQRLILNFLSCQSTD